MTYLLTGGSACGKSTFAEQIAVNSAQPLIYLAAMKPYGEEGEMRIKRHRKMRAGKGFQTIEKYTAFDEVDVPVGSTVLLECLCNLTANEMFDVDMNNADERILNGLKHIKERAGTFIIVTNDVGSDGCDYSELTLKYVDTLGRINIKAAELADTVIEMVCGIPIIIKGSLI